MEFRRRGVVPGGGARGGIRGGLAAARWGWQRLEEVTGTCTVIDRLEMDSVYVLRVRGCNKAGFGEYSEEVYLHTPPAPGKTFLFNARHSRSRTHSQMILICSSFFYSFLFLFLSIPIFSFVSTAFGFSMFCFPALMTTAILPPSLFPFYSPWKSFCFVLVYSSLISALFEPFIIYTTSMFIFNAKPSM